MKKVHANEELAQNIIDRCYNIREIVNIMSNRHNDLRRYKEDVYKEITIIREVLERDVTK